jgi:hypothetical protein
MNGPSERLDFYVMPRADGRCPAHSGIDMQQLGAVAGRRSAEVRRLRKRRVEDLVLEQPEARNTVLRAVVQALDANDCDAAVRALGVAFDKRPEVIAREDEWRRMLERRGRSLRDGSRWGDEPTRAMVSCQPIPRTPLGRRGHRTRPWWAPVGPHGFVQSSAMEEEVIPVCRRGRLS